MKKFICAVLAVLLVTTITLSGCAPATVNEATPDEVVTLATVDEILIESITTVPITTVVHTEQTTITEPVTTETTEPTKVEDTQKPATNNDKTESPAEKPQNPSVDKPVNNNSSSQTNNTKDIQAKAVAQKIADATYRIAYKKSSAPTDLELVSIACKLVGEYCRVCTYTTKDPDYYTAYGVFVKGVYTCAGSVRALGMVLDCMGYSWTHVNENQWDHQWCELNMDGKKGWADAYDGYAYGELGIGAGYGSYDSSGGSSVYEHFGYYKNDMISDIEDREKLVFDRTTWKSYYELGEEMLIEYYDEEGNFIKRQEYLNGELCLEYDVVSGVYTYYKFTVDMV